MKIRLHASNLTFVVILAVFSAAGGIFPTPTYAGQAAQAASSAGDEKQPQKEAAGKKSAGTSGFCGPRMPVRKFVVDASGSVSDTGRAFEGPVCIDVFYNPIQSYVSLATTTTVVNGPDLSKVTTGGGAAGAAVPLPKLPAPKNISQEFTLLMEREARAKARLQDTQSAWVSVVSDQDKAISDISLLRRTTRLRSPSQVVDEIKEGYKGLKDDLHTATTNIARYFPADKPAANGLPPLLSELQEISDRLARLPLAYLDVPALDSTTSPKPACKYKLQEKSG